MNNSTDGFRERSEHGDFWSEEWYRYLKLENNSFRIICVAAIIFSFLGSYVHWNYLFSAIILVGIFTSIGVFWRGVKVMLNEMYAISDWQMLINVSEDKDVKKSSLEKVQSNESFRYTVRVYKEHVIKLLRNQIALQIFLYAIMYRFNGIVDNNSGEIVYEWFESIYFSIVTWTTLGYGDYSPVSWSKLIAALQALTGYLTMAIIIGFVVKDYNKG